MNFKTQMQEDYKNIILNTDEFAESSTYSNDEETIPIDAIWEYEETEDEFETAGEYQLKKAKVQIAKADIAWPKRGDVITNADSEEFIVIRTIESDTCSHYIHAEEKKRKSIGTLLS